MRDSIFASNEPVRRLATELWNRLSRVQANLFNSRSIGLLTPDGPQDSDVDIISDGTISDILICVESSLHSHLTIDSNPYETQQDQTSNSWS